MQSQSMPFKGVQEGRRMLSFFSILEKKNLQGKPFKLTFQSSFPNISKTSARVSSGFQTRETFETTRPQAELFYCFRAFGNLMKPEAWVFEITSPTKKISLNYHLNKFSQFKYYDYLRREISMILKTNVHDGHDPIT